MFTPADHNPKISQTNYSDKVNGIINRDINRHPSLVSTLETIKDKLCDLEDNMAVLPIEDVKPDEDDDDPDYEPSDDRGSDDDSEIGSESGSRSRSSRTSSRDSLSSSGLSYKDVVVQGGPRQGRKLGLPIPTDIEISKNPPVAKLNLNPLLTSGVNRPRVSTDWIKQSEAAAANRRRHPQVPSPDMLRDDDSHARDIHDYYGGIASAGGVEDKPFISEFRRGLITQQDIQQEHNARWATIVPHPPGQQPSIFSRKEQRPLSANSSPSSNGSVQASQGSSVSGWLTGRRDIRVHPEPTPKPIKDTVSPIKDATNPGHGSANRHAAKTGELASLFKQQKSVTITGKGGSHKKRTRKHKKHPSISASRRPTRRRRIPPTEGHKYTRKRPRT